MKKRFLSIVTALALMLSLLPGTAWAADGTATEKTVSSSDTKWESGTYTASDNITINNRVEVSGNVTLTLNDDCVLTINGGIKLEDNDSDTRNGSTNSLTINVPQGSQGTGKLIANAQGNVHHAGIGGNGANGSNNTNGSDCGTLIINGGTITATGAYQGAGIGGGGATGSTSCSGGAGGTITITGGNVTANAGNGGNGAGIGGGGAWVSGNEVSATGGAGGTIVINGGTVTATGADAGAGIGAGDAGAVSGSTANDGDASTFSTGTNGKAVIHASSISDNDSRSDWSDIIFESNEGKVYGSQTLTEDFTIADNEKLTIPSDASLTVPADKKLTNNGTLTVEQGGTLTVISGGTLVNNGTIGGSGTLTPKLATVITGENKTVAYTTSYDLTQLFTIPTTAGTASYTLESGGTGTGTVSGTTLTVTAPGTFTIKVSTEETTFYAAGGQTATLTVNAAPEQTPNAAIDFGTETLTGLNNGSYTVNGSAVSPDNAGALAINSTWFGTTVSIVKKASDTNHADSAAQSLSIPARPTAPTVQGVNETVQGQGDGKITGTTTAMEYSSNSGASWTACTGTEVTGLAAGTYQVRTKATSGAFASAAATVTIASGATPTYGLTVTAPTFAAVTVGYDQPAAQTITMTNTGNTPATVTDVTVSGTAFTVSGSGNNWTIQPAAGLGVGTHTATITVIYNSTTTTATVSFTVNAVQPTDFTVTFNSQGGSAVADMTTTGGKLASLPTPTRSNYTFLGWFTAVSGGEKVELDKTYTADTTVYAHWSYNGSSGGGSWGGGGSSGGSSTSDKETIKNPDGSTTTIEEKKDGTVIEETKRPDGTVITTDKDKEGNTTEVVAKPDGSSVTTVEKVDGTVTITVVDPDGKVLAEVKLTEKALEGKETVEIPMPALPTSTDRETAPTVTLGVPDGVTVKVEIPVEDPRPGTVAILVGEDGSEQIVRTSVATEDGVALSVEGITTVKIVDNSKDFIDVPAHDWAADAVDFVSARELFNGTSEDTFAPDLPMSRAMLAKVLHNLENNPDAGLNGIFPDVDNGAWYAEAVSWASDKGIVSGYPDGSFGANDSISREQLAVMLWRYAGCPDPHGSLGAFPDGDEASGYAITALRWAVGEGILGGTDLGTLMPKASATRAQVAAMVMRFCENVE